MTQALHPFTAFVAAATTLILSLPFIVMLGPATTSTHHDPDPRHPSARPYRRRHHAGSRHGLYPRAQPDRGDLNHRAPHPG